LLTASRYIPLSRQEIVARLPVEVQPASKLLHHVMQFEADAQIEALRQEYAPFDPDPLNVAVGGDGARFLASFDVVLEDANFVVVGPGELKAAFDERSLFPLQAHVDLDEYDVLRIYRRGTTRRFENYRSPATLYRWKKREVVAYDRLVVVLRLNDESLSGRRTARMQGMEAGKIYIKSFKNIPTADLEMVLPNTRLRMRRADRLMVGGPLIAGVGLTIFNSVSILLAVAAGAFALSLDDPNVKALGGVLLVLGGYLWKTHSKIKTTRLKYLQTLSTGLYFRNLANNGAVVDQILGFAQAEEEKEAILAFALLQQGALSAKKLDASAEAWLRGETGRTVDFDVADGLASLDKLGLVHKHLGRWEAVDADTARSLLDARWDAAF
jgi:hypothetical protein